MLSTVRNGGLKAVIRPQCRSFFSFAPEVQTYSIRKLLKHPPSLMYKVVSDVESYSQFLPYCLSSTITSRDEQTGKPQTAMLKVGYKSFEESFESQLKLTEESVIAEAINYHLFDTLYTKWSIEPVNGGNDDKCVVDFNLKFAFNNPIYNTVSKGFGPTLASIMVKAFQERAEELSKLEK